MPFYEFRVAFAGITLAATQSPDIPCGRGVSPDAAVLRIPRGLRGDHAGSDAIHGHSLWEGREPRWRCPANRSGSCGRAARPEATDLPVARRMNTWIAGLEALPASRHAAPRWCLREVVGRLPGHHLPGWLRSRAASHRVAVARVSCAPRPSHFSLLVQREVTKRKDLQAG